MGQLAGCGIPILDLRGVPDLSDGTLAGPVASFVGLNELLVKSSHKVMFSARMPTDQIAVKRPALLVSSHDKFHAIRDRLPPQSASRVPLHF